MGKKGRRVIVVKKKARANDAVVACSNNGTASLLECTCPHCMGTAWKAGRGGSTRNPKKSEKRDKSRMKQAHASFLEEQAFMNDKKMNVEDFVNSIMGLDPKDAKKMVLYIERIQTLVSGSWAATTLEDICQIHEPNGEWSKIETKATSILEEIQHIRDKTGMSKKLCLEHDLSTPVEWKSHFNRAHGRIGLGKLEAAIEDLTEALVCHQAMMGFVHGLRKPEDEIDILYFRGECLFKLNDLDNAIVDFQAAHAGVRAVGDEWNGKPDRPMEVVKYLLMAMAKVKQASGQSRPLYSQQERDSIEKDLGLNSYYFENYHCLECGATPPAAKLKQCARCRNVWFCSKQCQAKSWKKDHQHSCDKQPGVTVCGDIDRAILEADFKELRGVTFSHTFTLSGKSVGQPRALLRDPVSGRLFDPLTDQDLFFLPSESSAYCSSLMAKPADKVEGNLLADCMDLKNIAKLSTTEVAWLKILAREVFIAVGDGKHAKAETKATTLVRMMQKDMNEISASVQFRPWVATFTLLSAFMHRAWSRHEMGKFELALDDAVAGLEQVGSMMEWTSQLQGPIQYFKREKVRLLFIRSQCLKRLGDFEAALTDLRDCLEIVKSFDGRWDDTSSHLSCKMVPLVADHFAPISEKQVVAFMQIVMALQKVKGGASRPHYSEEQRASLEDELGLSRLTFDRNTIALPKIVNNEDIGDWDKWAYEEHGVFVATVAGQVRVLVSDGNGGHFESITDDIYFVVDTEYAHTLVSGFEKLAEKLGATIHRM